MDRPSHALFCQDLKEYLERYIDVTRRYRRFCFLTYPSTTLVDTLKFFSEGIHICFSAIKP